MNINNTYILGHSAISPQQSFEGDLYKSGYEILNGNRIPCVEPDYTKLIDAKKIRRMSRIIRMSVAAGIKATENAGLKSPDAIIVGTSLGCLEDTDSFLSKMVTYNEDMLSPTAFIHSTHNTIASQIALHFKCYGYNSSYVHKSISFESALADAVMLLNEKSADHVLVGGADEIIENSFAIMNRLELVRNETIDQKNIKGFNVGEGASFFTISNNKNKDCFVKLSEVETLSFCSIDEVRTTFNNLTIKHHSGLPDLILTGRNGDAYNDRIINEMLLTCCPDVNTFDYKELCGEYGTSSAFGLWLACEILKECKLPQNPTSVADQNRPVKKILIYNQLQGDHHSFILVEKC